MSDFLWDKLWDFIVNLLSLIVGGGALVAYIELRRYLREKQAIETEEQRVAVDVVSSEISVRKWQVREPMSPEEKLRVYENQLQGTVKSYVILLEFVLRNTTSTEVVVTSLETEEPGVLDQAPPSWARADVYEVYDLQTGNYLGSDLDDMVTLEANGTVGRAVWIERFFDEEHKLETPPSTISVRAQTSERREVQHNITLRNVVWITKGRITQDGKKYYARATTVPPRLQQHEPTEDEIPF